MSTAVAERPSKPRKFLMAVPVKFNNVNMGDSIASIGFSTSRENLTVVAAETCLCGHRLNVRIAVGAGDANQKKFWDDIQWDAQAVADVKSFRVSPKRIISTLAFAMTGVDVSVLAHFAKQEGWLFVLKAEVIGEAEEEDESGDGDEEGEEESPHE